MGAHEQQYLSIILEQSSCYNSFVSKNSFVFVAFFSQLAYSKDATIKK